MKKTSHIVVKFKTDNSEDRLLGSSETDNNGKIINFQIMKPLLTSEGELDELIDLLQRLKLENWKNH